MGGVGLLTGLPELDPEPAGAVVFGWSRSRNFHPAPVPASTNNVKIFTNFSPKYFLSTLNY